MNHQKIENYLNIQREIHSIYDDLSLEEKNKLLTEAKKYSSKKENTGKIYSTLIGDLSPRERKIIIELKETDKYNRENKIILRKLLRKLTDKQLKEITELEDEYSREPLDFDDKDSIIEFIIDNIKLGDYIGKYLSKRKVNYDNLKVFIWSIPGEYGKILKYFMMILSVEKIELKKILIVF